MRAQILASQDLYLHISCGRWILANRTVPDFGLFSGTMPSAPWVAHEWLASVGMALLYDHLGWTGLVVATALLLAVAIGVLTFETVCTTGPVGALAAAVLGWGLCVGHLVARPHVLSLPLAVIWIAAHVRARRGGGVPPLYLAGLMALWANLHGAFLFGIAFTALFAAEAVLESGAMAEAVRAGRRWGLFLGAGILAAAVTPHGLDGLLFPIRMMGLGPAVAAIKEWQPSSVSNNMPLILWVFILIFASTLSGVRLPVLRIFMLLILLYMAFAHRRHTELLGLAAPLLLGNAIADRLSRSTVILARPWGVLARPAVVASVAGSVLIGVLLSLSLVWRDIGRGPDRFTPAAALAAVQARGITGPVLNAYNFGGYLIFQGYAPFVDGRADMYGNDFMTRYGALDQLPGLLEQYAIAWTIFEPGNPRAVVMDHLSGWSRLFADDGAVVHVRQARLSGQP